MKRLLLSDDNDGFSVQIKLGKKYLLSTCPEYNTQVIDLTQLVKRNYIKKNGILLKENERLDIRFRREYIFDIETYSKVGDGTYYEGKTIKDLSLNDYFDSETDLGGMNCLLINRGSLPDILMLDRYKVEVKELADKYLVSAKKTDSVDIMPSNNGLLFLLNRKDATMEECLWFLGDVYCDMDTLIQKMKEISFNCHMKRNGICDIYDKFLSNFPNINEFGLEKALQAYVQMSKEDFYLLCESYIKMGLNMREVVDKLPVFTNKSLPSPKEFVKLSKKLWIL